MSLVSLRQQQGNGRTSSAQSASLQVLISFFSFLSKSLRHMTLCACLVTPAAKRCQQWHHILQKPNRQPPAATSARYIAASISPSSHCASCHCHHLHWHQSNRKKSQWFMQDTAPAVQLPFWPHIPCRRSSAVVLGAHAVSRHTGPEAAVCLSAFFSLFGSSAFLTKNG